MTTKHYPGERYAGYVVTSPGGPSFALSQIARNEISAWRIFLGWEDSFINPETFDFQMQEHIKRGYRVRPVTVVCE